MQFDTWKLVELGKKYNVGLFEYYCSLIPEVG